MFLGSWEPSFDLKSHRVALPKKIRDYLATSKIILTFGFEKCIFGFDTETWQKESAKVLESSLDQRPARDNRRFFFASARIIEFDDQGRFVIPGDLLNWAQVRKPVIVGAGDHFEIWEKEIWAKHLKKLERVR